MDSTTDGTWTPATTDSTSSEYQYTTLYKALQCILLLGCAVILVGLNSLVVLSFLFKRIPRTLSNFYMFQLAIADGATGFFVFFNVFSNIFYTLSKSTAYCMFETIPAISCLMASTFCILGLTIDRLRALRNPLVYIPDMTTKKYITSALGVWIIPVTVFFILPMAWYPHLEDTPLKACHTLYILKREFTSYFFLPSIFLIFASVSVVYVPILKMAIKHSREIQAMAPDQNEIKMKSQLQILKTATMILLPYFAGWMPWTFFTAAIVYNDDKFNSPGGIFTVTLYIAYPLILTSGVNPIIYAARMPEYRQAFRAFFGCQTQMIGHKLST
ncbi:hypothetical protein CAPTEDRAFT_213949 [Capitella teleta]|uniref:G-protein coupled receptors family 1 profile domain-containing protein n=1 Tax=Capitella teleta TaxID=283909 RepID=R7VIQ9_CAPTE|nr:hypothetical protein CAPTEDRAFT_213949 [Capitella teleta]|eukprot:ELU15605.1 hypothetical protein CAPTEDRAFT_213949 [Capitella teleta]